ncbi:hypothetical protein E4T56_gene17176 [Termitomyces sp. T112]|nr:hypothetical protein C0989_001013 [Termitomyces sp. Mn162]KAG5717044.1 hypothetical protein E4T56_gene17176 [Termitomyces sp. T112]
MRKLNRAKAMASLDPSAPLQEQELRIWMYEGSNDYYIKATPEKTASPRTLRIWRMVRRKFLDESEIHIRNALTTTLKSLETPLLFVSLHLARALEEVAEGSDTECLLSFLLWTALAHGCIHWIGRKANPGWTSGKVTPYGNWQSKNIGDDDNTSEAGYRFEAELLSSVLDHMAPLTGRGREAP